MTKAVRIENADTSTFKVRVRVFEKAREPNQPDTLMQEHILAYPTAMTPQGLYITSTSYIIVDELPG